MVIRSNGWRRLGSSAVTRKARRTRPARPRSKASALVDLPTPGAPESRTVAPLRSPLRAASRDSRPSTRPDWMRRRVSLTVGTASASHAEDRDRPVLCVCAPGPFPSSPAPAPAIRGGAVLDTPGVGPLLGSISRCSTTACAPTATNVACEPLLPGRVRAPSSRRPWSAGLFGGGDCRSRPWAAPLRPPRTYNGSCPMNPRHPMIILRRDFRSSAEICFTVGHLRGALPNYHLLPPDDRSPGALASSPLDQAYVSRLPLVAEIYVCPTWDGGCSSGRFATKLTHRINRTASGATHITGAEHVTRSKSSPSLP